MDGLLIDSEPFWQKAHIEAVGKHGHHITNDDVRAMAGHKTIEIAQHWIEQFKIDTSSAALCEQIVEKVIICINHDGRALPGVHQALQLFAMHDVPMAIASSATPDVIEAVMDKLNLHDQVLFSYSAIHEAKGKPHPGVFLTTAKKLGVLPEQCLVFEDALSGIKAAKVAGMKCVAVPEKANINKAEFKDESDLLIPSLQDLTWDTVTMIFGVNKL